ncbi:cyclic nucleotide-binding domain-containing protein [Pedobacter sp. MC2016-14]|uniref:ATP-binding protein n=1 Tax=Pedobacter sp. MC2016-14 TaxID=2897327 RepID=UPI001E2E809E|nr:ATP-binding protein [Pedobacter sp. MC2016-14]MCD0488807.1 cyclic nucleotide-binding domain-containing protein [Pedobacter sp. MC2016-14]
MQETCLADLQNLEVFTDVPADQLQWLFDNSTCFDLQPGEFIFEEGDPVDRMFIILSGDLELYRLQSNNKASVAIFHKGNITGLLPFSRATVAMGYCQALSTAKVMACFKENLKELIVRHYELTQALVHVMTSRVREFTELAQQGEKMMALGKLSAGLAHELNNPAAAIVRSSSSLKSHLKSIPDVFKELISLNIQKEEIDLIHGTLVSAVSNPNRPHLTMLQRNELEDEVSDWLDEHEIRDAADMAENFVAFGILAKDLDEFNSHLPEGHLQSVLTWTNNSLITEQMVADIQEASKRIADLVGAVKIYTHMDGGGDKSFVDLHSGIRNTLAMMQYKIKKSGITVIEDFDASLPLIKALPGELNQVWTNIIDNATDVLDGQQQATLTIKTRKDHNDVHVYITDNGPGIPKDKQARIFDPFFTTKAIGKGTGLGLDVVSRIVKQHNGSVSVSSEPGKTEFMICFPINN